MYGGDGPACFEFLHGESCRGADALWREVGAAELRRKRHGKTSGVGGCNQLFGIRSRGVFKPRLERIFCVGENSAGGGNCPLPIFQTALPNRACFAFHCYLLKLRMKKEVRNYCKRSEGKLP